MAALAELIERKHSKNKSENPKYRLHDISSRILLDPVFNTKKEQASIDNGIYPAVTRCNKVPFIYGNKVKHVDGVPLKRSTEFDNHFYFGGLFHCGSVWSCPICSAKISHVRSEEIAQGFKNWQEIGNMDGKQYSQVMVSFTIPHYANQSICDLRTDFMLSRRMLKQQDELRRNPTFLPWKKICEEFGIKGTLSGIETTWGYNGWHPHSHDILFLDRKLTKDELLEIQTRLVTAWIYACKRSKVKMTLNQETAMYSRSVRVSNAPTAEEYITKFGAIDFEKHKDVLLPGWGAAQELTKSHIKKSRGEGGFTPWDFLRLIDQYPNDRTIYLKFGRLFREYIRAFSAKQQLFWSKGFKATLSIYILSDVEAVQEKLDKFEIVGIISKVLWRKIIKNKLRGQVLLLAQTLNFDDLMQFVELYNSD